MQYKCDFCHDTGNKEKDMGGHLTCIACEAPAERMALEAFIEKLPAMGEQEHAWRIHQRALGMAPKQEAPNFDMVPRQLVKEAIADLYTRMQKSYAAEPTLRITYMDLDAVHAHIKRLGIGGCLDGAEEILAGMNAAAPAVANGVPELPRAEFRTDMHIDGIGQAAYSADQMHAYGQACAAAGPDAALIEDAKRYRHLRNSASDDMPTWPISGSCWVVQYHHPQGTIPELKSAGFSSELDRAIDAAIALSGAKGN